MKTLNDHNEDAYKGYSTHGASSVGAGVACNNCGTEMRYQNINMVLASYPPKQTVVCPNCRTIDYKVS